MFVKQRQVRSSRFTSKFAKASTRRREHVASIYSMAVIQAFLFVFLIIGTFQSYWLMSNKFPGLSWYARFGVPLGVLLVAAVILRALVGSVRHAIYVQRASRRPKSDTND